MVDIIENFNELSTLMVGVNVNYESLLLTHLSNVNDHSVDTSNEL